MNEYPESGVVLVRQHGSYNWGKSRPLSLSMPHACKSIVLISSTFLIDSMTSTRQDVGTGQDASRVRGLLVRDGRQDDSSWDPARRRGQVPKEVVLLNRTLPKYKTSQRKRGGNRQGCRATDCHPVLHRRGGRNCQWPSGNMYHNFDSKYKAERVGYIWAIDLQASVSTCLETKTL